MQDVCWPNTWRIQGVHKAYTRRKQGTYKAYTRRVHGRHKAQSLHIQAIWASATGTRARVARVRAGYPSQLDYSGFWLRAARRSFLPSRLRRLRQTDDCRLLLPGVLTGSRQPPRDRRRPTSPGRNISGFVHLPQAPQCTQGSGRGQQLGCVASLSWSWAHAGRVLAGYMAYTRRTQGVDKA